MGFIASHLVPVQTIFSQSRNPPCSKSEKAASTSILRSIGQAQCAMMMRSESRCMEARVDWLNVFGWNPEQQWVSTCTRPNQMQRRGPGRNRCTEHKFSGQERQDVTLVDLTQHIFLQIKLHFSFNIYHTTKDTEFKDCNRAQVSVSIEPFGIEISITV